MENEAIRIRNPEFKRNQNRISGATNLSETYNTVNSQNHSICFTNKKRSMNKCLMKIKQRNIRNSNKTISPCLSQIEKDFNNDYANQGNVPHNCSLGKIDMNRYYEKPDDFNNCHVCYNPDFHNFNIMKKPNKNQNLEDIFIKRQIQKLWNKNNNSETQNQDLNYKCEGDECHNNSIYSDGIYSYKDFSKISGRNFSISNEKNEIQNKVN